MDFAAVPRKLLVIFRKKKIKQIDPVALRVPDKRETVDLMRQEGLKRLKCLIYGLVGIIRAQQDCSRRVYSPSFVIIQVSYL